MRRFAAALILVACAAAPARADFAVCNKSAHSAKLAFGRFNGTGWMSEGWWTIPPGKCETLLNGALKARYYYLYASDGGAGTWDGSKGFCVGTGAKFAIVGRGHCAARGYDRKGFFEVDTGQKAGWVHNLSD